MEEIHSCTRVSGGILVLTWMLFDCMKSLVRWCVGGYTWSPIYTSSHHRNQPENDMLGNGCAGSMRE